MTSSGHRSAMYRRKKMDENPAEFRAKEALRLRNYRQRVKQRRSLLEESSCVAQDKHKLLDDVDAWFYNTVESHSRASHSERSSHLSSTHPTPPSQSPSRGIDNLQKNDETVLTRSKSTTVTFQDVQKYLADGRKMLQEWNMQWGSSSFFLHRAANSFLGIGASAIPEDRAHDTHKEILSMAHKGRHTLLQLETIALIDFRSIQVDDFKGFWIETMRVIEGLNDWVGQANAVHQLRLYGNADRVELRPQ